MPIRSRDEKQIYFIFNGVWTDEFVRALFSIIVRSSQLCTAFLASSNDPFMACNALKQLSLGYTHFAHCSKSFEWNLSVHETNCSPGFSCLLDTTKDAKNWSNLCANTERIQADPRRERNASKKNAFGWQNNIVRCVFLGRRRWTKQRNSTKEFTPY